MVINILQPARATIKSVSGICFGRAGMVREKRPSMLLAGQHHQPGDISAPLPAVFASNREPNALEDGR